MTNPVVLRSMADWAVEAIAESVACHATILDWAFLTAGVVAVFWLGIIIGGVVTKRRHA